MSTLTEGGRRRRAVQREVQLTYREAINAALERRDGGGPDRAPDGRGRRRRTAASSRPTSACLETFGPQRVAQHPDLRERLHGRRPRHVHHGPAAGRRDHVRRLPADRRRRHRQNQLPKYRFMSGGQPARPGHGPRHRGGHGRFGTQHSATGESWYMGLPGLHVVTASTRPRVRAAPGGDPPRRPGAVLRAQGSVRPQGPRSTRRGRRVRQGRGDAQRRGRHHRRDPADGRAVPRRPPSRWSPRASTRRSSTCAGSGRWIWTVGRRSPAPGAWSSSRSRSTRAAGARRSSRGWPSRRADMAGGRRWP